MFYNYKYNQTALDLEPIEISAEYNCVDKYNNSQTLLKLNSNGLQYSFASDFYYDKCSSLDKDKIKIKLIGGGLAPIVKEYIDRQILTYRKGIGK